MSVDVNSRNSETQIGGFVTFLVVFFLIMTTAAVGYAQDELDRLTEELHRSAKLIDPDSILSEFQAGSETARVIIGLKEPAGLQLSSNFNDAGYRKTLQESVRSAQENVINGLGVSGMAVTNRFTYVFAYSAEVSINALSALVNRPDVAYVNKDDVVEMHLAQGIPLMNASDARTTYNGAGIAIAVCDTGIDYTHEKLGNGAFPNDKVIGGYDCGDNDADPMDMQGHGTCCAGIAAGDLPIRNDYIGGVAYNAKLYAVKISSGSGGSAFSSDMIEGWEWCVTHQNDDPDNPIMIISTSFGGGNYNRVCDGVSPAMTTAAANAVAAGITIFVSSGNDGYCNGMGWPACISSAISVGAVYDAAFGTNLPCVSSVSCADKIATTGCDTGFYVIDNTAEDMVTSYSNSASFLDLFAPSNRAFTLDISGSGGYNSGGDYYAYFGGTSAACPYAAGAAAVVQSYEKSVNGAYLTPGDLLSRLSSTGVAILDAKSGITKPRVDVGNAVSQGLPTVSYWPDCSGDTVYIQNVTFPSGTDVDCSASVSIVVGPGVIVQSGARVWLSAPEISVAPGFQVEDGADVQLKQ